MMILDDGIRFSVYGEKGLTIYPLYTSNKICDKTCNLFLIENGNENHYVWIKDFNKLMNSQSKNGYRFFLLLLLFTTFDLRRNTKKIMLRVALKLMLPKK